MKNVLSSTMEAELGALFFNFQRGAALRVSLQETVHPQPPTPALTDSDTVYGFVNDNIRQHRSSAIYMHLYWVCDRVRQVHYLVNWRRVKDNLANYFTKHHPSKHHREFRSTYLFLTADKIKHYCYKVYKELRGGGG